MRCVETVYLWEALQIIKKHPLHLPQLKNSKCQKYKDEIYPDHHGVLNTSGKVSIMWL